MNTNEVSIKCSNCDEPLEPNMDKCPKCGSKDRDIGVYDEGRGQETVTGYAELSSSFTIEQKTIAEKYHLDENTLYLKQIAENSDKTVKLLRKQKDDAVNEAKRQKRYFYISVTIAVVAIIVTITIAWLHL